MQDTKLFWENNCAYQEMSHYENKNKNTKNKEKRQNAPVTCLYDTKRGSRGTEPAKF